MPFGFIDLKWPGDGAACFVNTSVIDSGMRERLVDAATEVWNDARSGFALTDGGATCLVHAQDGKNVIGWSMLPEGVVARATSYSDAAGNRREADLLFSNAYTWTDGNAGPGAQDIQSTTMHEPGHWLKLLDQYSPADMPKLMYGCNNDMPRRLDDGACAGINWICPGGGPELTPSPAPTLTPTPTSTPTPTPPADTGDPCAALRA